MSRSFLRLAPLLAALALLTPTLGTASAADNSDVAAAANAATLPKGLAGELNAGAPPAIVSFNDLVSAADARRIRAAVVDPATRWVAATDTNGHTVAAQAPPLRYGTSWDPTRRPAWASAWRRPRSPGPRRAWRLPIPAGSD